MARRFAWQEMGKRDAGALTVSTRCTRTRAEIMASVSRRWASGEASHLARFSSKQVLLIRKLYIKGNVTQSALAERFGMSTSNMKRILARRSWKRL
jgi:DNA-binding MarR family transcriptional regulator